MANYMRNNLERACEKINVIQLIRGLPMGGAETLVKDYALLIDKERYELTVLCLTRFHESPYEQMLQEAGIRCIYITDFLPHVFRGMSLPAKIFRKIPSFFWVKKILRQQKPDILHSHLELNLLVKFAVPPDTAIIHTVHNEPRVIWHRGKEDNIICRFRKYLDYNSARWLVEKRNMHFIALNNAMKQEINERFGVKDTVVLKNGIDFSRFQNQESAEVVRGKIGIPKDAFVIGHIGRFSYQKNHLFLVEIFLYSIRRNANAFLLMIGTGEGIKAVKDKLRDYNLDDKYMILENRADVPDLLNCMDVFCFPSLYEGLPITLLEAQKIGLRCIISDVITHEAIVSNMVKVLSLSDGAEKWADEICNGILPERIESTISEWDMNYIIRDLEKLYQEIVSI